jgi:hypothetical protein
MLLFLAPYALAVHLLDDGRLLQLYFGHFAYFGREI